MQGGLIQIKLALDPTGQYEKKLGEGWQEKCIEVMGVLPEFMFGPHESLSLNMEKNYQFFMCWHDAKEASIQNDCYCYPGDEPIPAVLKAQQEDDEIIYIFTHAIVAVADKDGKLVKWTRMD